MTEFSRVLEKPELADQAPIQGQSAAELFGQSPPMTEYICHVSRRVPSIYIETPKVACTTIKRVLQAAELGPGRQGDLPAKVHDRSTSPLGSPGQDPQAFLEALLDPDVFTFTFVRNPFSRILSCWLDKMVTNGSERRRMAPGLGLNPEEAPSLLGFLEAIAAQPAEKRDVHWTTQTHLISPQRIRYTYIGRFENFRPDFARICTHLGIEAFMGDLPRTWHATDANTKVQSHIGDAEAALIRTIYEADFRNFGYGWGTELT